MPPGIVTALHYIPVGEVQTTAEIRKGIDIIEQNNLDYPFKLNWNIVESLPVHEHVKRGCTDRDEYIENYKESLKNLAQCGITIVCYNFMPVLDWLRTNVMFELEDGSRALFHNIVDLVIFDLFILKRRGAENNYDPEILEEARKKNSLMNKDDKEVLQESLLMTLPGDKNSFTLEKLRHGLDGYADVSEKDLKDNLICFPGGVIPTAEEVGVMLAIHPDDPPWPVLGLPRVVSIASDLQSIFRTDLVRQKSCRGWQTG